MGMTWLKKPLAPDEEIYDIAEDSEIVLITLSFV